MNIKVISREYKLLLDHREFRDRKAGTATYGAELVKLAAPVKCSGVFESTEKRTIVFLDTPDFSLRRLGLILRYRNNGEVGELTLKCRSEDRYFAAGTAIFETNKPKDGEKLEEDIGSPFVSRFSKSKTIQADRPTTWGEAAKRFPLLATLTLDEHPLSDKIKLGPVHNTEVFERVYKGPTLEFDDSLHPKGKVKSSTALILWSDGKEGRPLVVEFSFRLKDDREEYSRELAGAARSFFQRVQRHGWTLPAGGTKTGFIYGDSGLD